MALKSKRGKSKDSMKDINELGNLMTEVSEMLELSLEQRDLATSQLYGAQSRFEQMDNIYRSELAGLPPDLDAYLRLVRDQKKMEQRKRALEAQSQTSHALNFHLGGNAPTWGAGPSIMDELRAEEAELDKQALEDEQRQIELEQSINNMSSEEDNTTRRRRRKKKSESDGGNRARAKTDAEVEAHMKFNLRDGLFAHLDAGMMKETELEAKVHAAEENSLERLEAETELARFRNKQSQEVASFFDEYNPQRLQRGKEESLVALGLYLPDPTEIVASVEEETLNNVEVDEEPIDEVQQHVLKYEKKLGIPPLEKPSIVPVTTAEGILTGSGGGSTMLKVKQQPPPRIIPGYGVSERMSDNVVKDPLHGRSILDLPTNLGGNSNSTSQQQRIASPTLNENRPSSSKKKKNVGGGDVGDDIVNDDDGDIRGTVLNNTSHVDLSFPSLEFRRKKGDDKNSYFQPGAPPPVYKVSQSDGAVWSAMARERRELEAIDRKKLQGNNDEYSTSSSSKPKKKIKKKKKVKKIVNKKSDHDETLEEGDASYTE